MFICIKQKAKQNETNNNARTPEQANNKTKAIWRKDAQAYANSDMVQDKFQSNLPTKANGHRIHGFKLIKVIIGACYHLCFFLLQEMFKNHTVLLEGSKSIFRTNTEKVASKGVL